MRRIIFNVLSYSIYAAICSLAVFWVGLFVPRRWFDPESFWFSEHAWENGGKIYNCVAVSRWKNSLPDMSKYAKRLLLKKLNGGETAEDIEDLIRETCVAETAHIFLVLLAFGMLVMNCDASAALCALLYAVGNFPYIIIQRYNRPRLRKMLERMNRRKSVCVTGDEAAETS